MLNRRWRARWALTFLLPVLAACTSQAPVPSAPPPSPLPSQPATTATPPATLPPRPTPMPCLTRAELAAMPLEEIAEQPSVCFVSEDGVQTEIAQTEAVEAIRDFLQDPSRLIGFREVTFMGNSPSGVLRVARFEDERGVSYLVAVVAEKVLEMDPGASQPQTSGATLSQDELQAIAEELVRRELPAFDELRDRLAFEVGAKDGGLNFFRWEQPGVDEPSGLPPLAQVGITDSGEIFSYINTLYFLP
jgi:hypothetical protein